MLTMNKAVKLFEEAQAMQRENSKSHRRSFELKDLIFEAALERQFDKVAEFAEEAITLKENRILNLQAIDNRYAKIKEGGFLRFEVKQQSEYEAAKRWKEKRRKAENDED